MDLTKRLAAKNYSNRHKIARDFPYFAADLRLNTSFNHDTIKSKVVVLDQGYRTV
jgi:hypothetical protein